jgi:hypothetical protein
MVDLFCGGDFPVTLKVKGGARRRLSYTYFVTS